MLQNLENEWVTKTILEESYYFGSAARTHSSSTLLKLNVYHTCVLLGSLFKALLRHLSNNNNYYTILP